MAGFECLTLAFAARYWPVEVSAHWLYDANSGTPLAVLVKFLRKQVVGFLPDADIMLR